MECPICGNREYSPYLECKDHSISQEIFTIKNCTTCGLLTTIDAPSQQHIGPYYASINYIICQLLPPKRLILDPEWDILQLL